MPEIYVCTCGSQKFVILGTGSIGSGSQIKCAECNKQYTFWTGKSTDTQGVSYSDVQSAQDFNARIRKRMETT